jgi:hypothetical protein
MSETHWHRLTENALDSTIVSAGWTDEAAFSPPSGTKCMGYHLLEPARGFAGHVISDQMDSGNMFPIANGKGGMIVASVKKYNQGDQSPMIFFCNGLDPTGARGYQLGLSRTDPTRIILRKGLMDTGLDPDDDDVLRVSSYTIPLNTWVQLRLYLTVHTHGELVLLPLRADPPTYPPGAGTAIDGMDAFYDDTGGILSGQIPIAGGWYTGFGVHFGGEGSGRVGLFDHVYADRQSTP